MDEYELAFGWIFGMDSCFCVTARNVGRGVWQITSGGKLQITSGDKDKRYEHET